MRDLEHSDGINQGMHTSPSSPTGSRLDLLELKQLGEYEVVEPIGRGSILLR